MDVFPKGADLAPPKRVKFGIDPTSDRLHLGHLIPLRVVHSLQEKGHKVTLVLGTFTAQMGDPSGQDKTRPILDRETVEANAERILAQTERVLLPGFEVFRNGTVFNAMTVPTLLQLAAKFTVSQMMTRDSFAKRSEANQPVGLHELIVPLLQGWDSVVLASQIEVGGQDQLFNFQVARQLQEMHGQEPQASILMPVINGTDGRKMSKSFGNCVFLDDLPVDVYGKCMSVSDATMEEWFPVLTDLKEPPLPAHPMEKKKAMAFDITRQLWGAAAAHTASLTFESVIQCGEEPESVPEVAAGTLLEAVVVIRQTSRSGARRLIESGAVTIQGEKIYNDQKVTPGTVVKVGKRHYGRIHI